MEVRRLRRALRDLDVIATYIARENTAAAQSLIAQIRDVTEQLANYPYLGRASERADVRELVVHRHYLVSYRVRPERVEILQVWHTAQNRRR